jgi:hypothetical protein
MPTLFDSTANFNPIFINLQSFDLGEVPDDEVPTENRLGSIIATREHFVTVVQVVDEDTVVLAIKNDEDDYDYNEEFDEYIEKPLGDVEPNLDPKLLMKWDDLMRQDYSKATEQLEFVT